MDFSLRIVIVNENSPYLQDVITLADENSAVLGFLAEEAFKDYAKKQNILAAVSETGELIGYVMYRCSRQKRDVAIAHLCINREWRGRGIARRLVNELSQRTKDYYGIRLWCRRDYPANSMWPHLGFVAKAEKPGRSRTGELLTFWWLDHGYPDLFSTAAQTSDSKLLVVIDNCIFLDWYAEDISSHESRQLLSDWIQPEVEFYITDELFNEINRNKNSSERERLRSLANRFTSVKSEPEIVEEVSARLRLLFRSEISQNDWSDLRHLALTIAASQNFPRVSFFLTRDTRLIKIAERIYDEFKLQIIRPLDLILYIDELKRESEYQPKRLAGIPNIEVRRTQGGQENILTDTFLLTERGERKADFQRRIRQVLSDPQNFDAYGVYINSDLIAFFVCQANDNEVEIPIIRLKANPLMSTLSEYLIRYCILHSVKADKFTRITENLLDEIFIAALQNNHFVNIQSGWLKINLSIVESIQDLSYRLSQISTQSSDYLYCLKFTEQLNREMTACNHNLISDIERVFWPAKVSDGELPSWIIPIKPYWAQPGLFHSS